VKQNNRIKLKKPTVISFLNYKGGVGKTNVSVNFAFYAAACKLSTLLIDWDPQGDATEYIGFGRENVKLTMFDFLVDNLPIEIDKTVMRTAFENLYIIGANSSLKNVENLVARSDDTFETFRDIVHQCSQQFDLVVIDCPPANSHVNIASIYASTDIFVVSTTSSDSIEKINLVNQMIDNISSVIESNVSPEELAGVIKPQLKGIVLTMGVENTVGLDVAKEHVKHSWGNLFMDPIIPRAVVATYSVGECVPVIKSKPQEKISRRYTELFKEVLSRVS
jgi:chromosome partitioning protein